MIFFKPVNINMQSSLWVDYESDMDSKSMTQDNNKEKKQLLLLSQWSEMFVVGATYQIT